MKQDKHKTDVMFLIHKPESELDQNLFAFFPNEKYNNTPNLFTSYRHVGQHSACHLEYAEECVQASYAEYQFLLKELIGLGYNFNVLNSQVIEYHRKPTKAEIMFGHGVTHYKDFLPEKYLNVKTGDLKSRLKDIDGLIYTH